MTTDTMQLWTTADLQAFMDEHRLDPPALATMLGRSLHTVRYRWLSTGGSGADHEEGEPFAGADTLLLQLALIGWLSLRRGRPVSAASARPPRRITAYLYEDGRMMVEHRQMAREPRHDEGELTLVAG